MMTPAEFKERWDGDDEGGGITFDDIADCAVAWGLYARPKTKPMAEVCAKVLARAGVER